MPLEGLSDPYLQNLLEMIVVSDAVVVLLQRQRAPRLQLSFIYTTPNTHTENLRWHEG